MPWEQRPRISDGSSFRNLFSFSCAWGEGRSRRWVNARSETSLKPNKMFLSDFNRFLKIRNATDHQVGDPARGAYREGAIPGSMDQWNGSWTPVEGTKWSEECLDEGDSLSPSAAGGSAIVERHENPCNLSARAVAKPGRIPSLAKKIVQLKKGKPLEAKIRVNFIPKVYPQITVPGSPSVTVKIEG